MISQSLKVPFARVAAELTIGSVLYVVAATVVSLTLKAYGDVSDPVLHVGVLSAYFALLVFLMIVNLAVAGSLRRSTYFFYAAFLFFHGFNTAFYEQWLTLWEGSFASWNELFRLAIPLSIVALLYFSQGYLTLPKRDPLMQRICEWLKVIWALLLTQALLIALPQAQSMVTAIQTILAPATGLFLVIAGIRAWLRGQLEARLFTVAFAIHLLGLVIFLWLKGSAAVAPLTAYYQLLLASACEITLLAIGLVDLLRRSLQERNQAQAEAIANLERVQKVEAEYAQKLEKDVEARTKELANVNAHKDRLISILAHDLRSPLNSINQICEYSLRNDEDMSAEIRDTMEGILESGKGLYELLENLLCWAQWQNDTTKTECVPVKPELLAKEALRLFRFQAEMRKQTLILDIQSKAIIMTEPHMLKVILRNLLSNAINHTTEGGNITLRYTDEGGTPNYCIVDTGPGLSENALRAWQSNAEGIPRGEASESGGIGLGLVLCRNLTEKLGGTLSIENVAEAGASFTLRLPEGAIQN